MMSFGWFQVEERNKTTAWNPAPEDEEMIKDFKISNTIMGVIDTLKVRVSMLERRSKKNMWKKNRRK